MPNDLRGWAQENEAGNMSLLYSAEFYLSARRLLVPPTATSVLPGFVCAAYAIEQVIKAGLLYRGLTWDRRHGHNLTHLANLFPTATEANTADLELLATYFDSRYFDNESPREGLQTSHYSVVDDLYFIFYSTLNIPLEFHWRLGLLCYTFKDEAPEPAEHELLERFNGHFSDYADLRRRSLEKWQEFAS